MSIHRVLSTAATTVSSAVEFFCWLRRDHFLTWMQKKTIALKEFIKSRAECLYLSSKGAAQFAGTINY